MVAENLGRLFEVGFNIGVLAAIAKYELSHNLVNLYRRDLENLRFPKMRQQIVKDGNIIDPADIEKVKKWGLFLIQKGWLSGFNFFREYVESLEKDVSKYEIVYYQCCFSGDNSIKQYPKDGSLEVSEWLSQLGDAIAPSELNRYREKYSGKGEFLKADTLMLLRRRRTLKILAIDLSVFSVKETQDLLDLQDKDLVNQRRLLWREISYLKSKSAFAKLRLDTGTDADLDLEFSDNLKHYFTAFKRRDKESTKLIQAASYAYSFYGFLREVGIVNSETDTIINAVGYSDRGISSISLNPKHSQHLDLLKTCNNIYKNEPRDEEIATARKQVFQTIRRNLKKSFEDGNALIDKLSHIQPDCINIIPPHTEIIDHFSSTLELRQPHAEKVKAALASDNTYIFLTGNPGIGKTTAIVEFLKTHIDEGFLFFYVSPRKQVNLDIIEKFKNPETKEICDDRLFCMTTNSTLIDNYAPAKAVNYLSQQKQGEFSHHAVTFVDLNEPPKPFKSHQNAVQRITDSRLKNAPHKRPGVLSTLCEAVRHAVKDGFSNNIVATACIQSLRMTATGRNTLENFRIIFKDAYNKRSGTVNSEKMGEISGRIKHLFIMIDEITGDHSGVDFLSEIKKIIGEYELSDRRHGFNTKVIVADASIVDPEVITQHLSETSAEPDKIFFRRVSDLEIPPLSQREFKFNRLPAIAINANSYPAKQLSITYKAFVESVKFNEEKFFKQKDKLSTTILQQILDDINALRSRPGTGQILVYIQNKQKLQQLIESIQKQEPFVKNEDYLEVHANLSESDRKEIGLYRDRVKVVFMTSSASRGLSFPKSQHILVEIPQFQVESNLMEIIQVIYRCRGEFSENGKSQTLDNTDKELTFYLCDRAVYYGDDSDPELSIQESVLNLFNLLLILKTAIMTRIRGYGKIGRDHFLIIPIGGKSLSASGESLTGQLATLIKELKKEYHRNRKNTTLAEIYDSLQNLLSRGEFLLRQDGGEKRQNLSYLDLREKFNHGFEKRCDRLDNLLDIGDVELGYICGSLLLVPLNNQNLEETYEIRLAEIVTHATDNRRNKMIAIRESSQYPESLRSLMGRAIALIDKLKEPRDRTQRLEQHNRWTDQYYAIPLFAFIVGDIIRDYFQNEQSKNDQKLEGQDNNFRDILSQYIYQLYPVDQVLPIGDRYREFPFVIFRSYSLEQMRSKIFSDRYLLTSTELNILNIILMKSNPTEF
ncbi:MAG: helicase-related protein [Limnospira sp.]